MPTKATQQLNALIGKSAKKGKHKGGGARKIGRYSKHPASVRYRAERRWETNKPKRIRRHIKRQPGDDQARSILATIGDSEDRSFLAATPKPAAA